MSEDMKWIWPHDQMGLSFSSTFKNLKSVYKLKQRHNPKAGHHIYWMIEKADIPNDLKFVPDANRKGHYFLTVTKRMTTSQLVQKLKTVAQRMSVIKDGSSAL